MSKRLTGKTIAITGGARGIGLATARACLDEGARVAIGDLDFELAQRAARDLPGAMAFALDVTDEDSFRAFLDGAKAHFGQVDVLVNNAGLMLTGEFLQESAATESKMIGVNLHGVIVGCKLAGREFTDRGHGQIINIASMAGIAGFPGVVTYCATKFGVVGLSTALREEFQGTGVDVSAILPGIVHTELSAGVKMPAIVESFVSVEPEDIARAVVSAIVSKSAMTYSPGRLKWTLRAALTLPEGPRRLVSKLARLEKVYLNVDQATRDAYHSRATGGAGK